MRMARPGPGKGLAPDEVGGDAELEAGFADLVLKQVAQRFDQRFEGDDIRQATNIVVALDHGGITHTAFDDVRVDRALDQEIDFADFLAFFFKDADEFLANDFALAFGIGNTGELAEEAVLGIDANQIHVELLLENPLDRVTFIFAEQAMVDEDAGQVVADCFVDHDSSNG